MVGEFDTYMTLDEVLDHLTRPDAPTEGTQYILEIYCINQLKWLYDIRPYEGVRLSLIEEVTGGKATFDFHFLELHLGGITNGIKI